MQLLWTCTWQLLLAMLSAATEPTHDHQLLLPAANELLVRATADIVLQHYTTFTSKQLYVRWENDAADALTDELLRRTATHLSVLLERNPPTETAATRTEQRLGPQQQLRVLNLLLVGDYAEFDHVIGELTDELYDFSGLYTVLLVGASNERRNLETAGTILRTLWTLYIVNVVVLIGPREGKGEVRLYTYFPYGEGYCERALPVVWNVYERDVGFVHRQRTPFPMKLRNFYNCPLVVATFPVFPFIMVPHRSRTRVQGVADAPLELEGIEGMVLRTLRQRLNFRLQIIIVDPPDWGTAGPRDQATGASAYIRQLRANLTIGYWATTLHRNRYMANSFSYYTSQLVLAVAPGESYTSLELLRCPFANTIWILLLVSLTVGLGVIGFLRYRTPTTSASWPGMVSVLFGAGLARVPVRSFDRTLLLCWFASTLVLRSAYTGSMIRFLQSDRNHSVPDSVPALLDGGYELFMYRNYSFIFDAYPQVGRRVQLVTAQQFRHRIVNRLQRPGDRLSVLLPLETVTFLNRNLTRAGQLLRVARNRAFVAKLAIYTQRTSTLLGPLNMLLERFVSSGLLNRWAAQYHQLQFLADPYRDGGRQQLVLAEMDGPFAILLVGLGLSSD
uniref:Putative ionotropic receptor ligand binding domain-containing protein n=1 Tax=Anopheles christyi TaxID=43041 RepID=A0A182K145_9DIPT